MLCRECGHSEYEHEAGQICPNRVGLFRGAGREREMITPQWYHGREEELTAARIEKAWENYTGDPAPFPAKEVLDDSFRLVSTSTTEFNPSPAAVRLFESGATRDQDVNKLDYEGFLSPRVLQRFAEYMHENRKQTDGALRDSDNWQKGIPKDAYMKSLLRHLMDVWLMHRAKAYPAEDMEKALCAVIFNAQGYLFELLR